MFKEDAKNLARSLQQKLNVFGYICIKESDLDSISEALNVGFNFVCRDNDVDQDIVNTMDKGVQAYRSLQESKGIKLGHCQEVVAQMGGLNGWNSVAALKLPEAVQPKKTQTMTREQIYVQHKGLNCPCCGSENFSGSEWNADAGYATQEMGCDDCNATWDDVYDLTGINISSEGDEMDVAGTSATSETHTGSHVFYRTGDTDTPEAIKDRNGDVILQQCRLCGQAEGDLTEVCSKKFTEAGIIAEVHSDDRIVEVEFDASAWFKQASDKEILALADIEWGGNYEADNVASFYEATPDVAEMFDYVHLLNSRSITMGFECNVDESSAMTWLKTNKQDIWAQILCATNGVRLVEAQEDEIKGMWDWLDDAGNACDCSFDTMALAALDAVHVLKLS